MNMDPDDLFNVKKEHEIQSLPKNDIQNSFEMNNNVNDQIPKTSGGFSVIDVIEAQLKKSDELDIAELTEIITSYKPNVSENTNQEIVETSNNTSEKNLALTKNAQANEKIVINQDLYQGTKSSNMDEVNFKDGDEAIIMFNNTSNSELEKLTDQKVHLSNQYIDLANSNLYVTDISEKSVGSKADVSNLDSKNPHMDVRISIPSSSKDVFEEEAKADSELCIKDLPNENEAYHDEERTDEYESPLTLDFYKRGRVETSLKKLGEMVRKEIEIYSRNASRNTLNSTKFQESEHLNKVESFETKADNDCPVTINNAMDVTNTKESNSGENKPLEKLNAISDECGDNTKPCIKVLPNETEACYREEQTDENPITPTPKTETQFPLDIGFYNQGRVETSLKRMYEIIRRDNEIYAKNYLNSSVKTKNEVPDLMNSTQSYHSIQSTKNYPSDTNASDSSPDSSKAFVKASLPCEELEVLKTCPDLMVKSMNDYDAKFNLKHSTAKAEVNGHVQEHVNDAENCLGSDFLNTGSFESPRKSKLTSINESAIKINDEGSLYYLTSEKTDMEIVRRLKLSTNGFLKSQILRCRSVGFICNFCGENFRSKTNFIQHKRQYISYKPSGAYICSKYSNQYCIIRYNSRMKKIQYKCSHCQKKFTAIGDYSRHCNEHICKKKRSYLVSPFVNECMLDNGERGFECFLCQESSTVYADIKFHECLIIRDKPEKCFEDLSETDPDKKKRDVHQCEPCGKNFPNKEDLDDHCEIHKKEEKETFNCGLCGSEFTDRASLDSHLEDHASGRRFECKVCFKSYSRLCSYKTHMKNHQADKGE